MRRTNVGSSNALPLRVIPDLGQVSENSLHSPSKQSCDVLHDDVAGSKLANDSRIFRPQSAAFAVDSRPLASVRNILAGESSADDVNGSEVIDSAFSDIAEPLGVREMAFEHSPAVIVDFDLPDGFDSRALEAKIKSSDSAE
jgi:hypothetical protein